MILYYCIPLIHIGHVIVIKYQKTKKPSHYKLFFSNNLDPLRSVQGYYC